MLFNSTVAVTRETIPSKKECQGRAQARSFTFDVLLGMVGLLGDEWNLAYVVYANQYPPEPDPSRSLSSGGKGGKAPLFFYVQRA